ncbi:MAG: acetate--CoA ligase family protein [Methylobacterium mesophilicum]|nr:acetate--CoA ligase family protein [Methylobacterium mesophilicum]
MTRLERLLRPRSIAIIGGGAFGTNVVKQSLKMGFAGDIWPVHPTKSTVEGVRAYRSIADLPSAPDAVFIGVNRFLTIEMVRALREKGAGGAICFAAGFLEAGNDDPDGARLQAELIEAAGAMPVIGPNCYGLINYADGALLWPDQHGGRRLADGQCGAAIITQSSNIACNLTMQQRGLPVAFLMTAGNQAQTMLAEMALGLIEDERVSCLGLHIEGFGEASGFERLARRARELRKPIVAMKVGSSEQARAATVSHTASLAGSDAASDAFLKRIGIARVETIPAFLETLKLFHNGGPLAGRRLSSMSCSGGEASVMADSAEGRGVGFPPLAPDHRARIKETLGPLVAVANPLDYHTFIWNDRPAMTATFGAMASGGFDLNLLVLDFPRADRCSDADWWTAVDAFEAGLKAHGARGAIVATMLENLSESHAEELFRRGITPLHGVAEAFSAAEAAAFVGDVWARAEARSVAGGRACLTPVDRAEDMRLASAGGGRPSEPMSSSDESPPASISAWGREMPLERGDAVPPGNTAPENTLETLSESAAKSLLRVAGIPVPPGLEAGTPEAAVSAARVLGLPVVVKALGIAHKSEAQAVRLDLQTERAVREAADQLDGLGTGLYVERMIAGDVAELIVGITRDPIFGPVMTLGTGGVLVELLKDTATLLLPSSRDAVEQALRGLRLFPLLDGYRGRPKADLVAALDAIEAIASFALRQRDEIEELDINPLIVCRENQGAWAADALLVMRRERGSR